MTQPDPAILEANLAAIAGRHPRLAQRLHAQQPASLDWHTTPQGELTASIPARNPGDRPIALASKYNPLLEAARLADGVDIHKHACICVLGVGLGYHLAEIARRMGKRTVLIAFEPDLALLRAVLERIDHTAWLSLPLVILADAETDRAQLVHCLDHFTSLVTQGATLVNHPPTRRHAPEAVTAFAQRLTEALGYCRTQMATSLVNSARTYRNFMMNLGRYAAGDTVNALHNAAVDVPAVCVSAGPSLARNIALLQDPDYRRGVIVITAQTTLKALLARGVKPDIVTALDYAEISQRFYEGLPDLPDVTLVAEPLAHTAILESFPGPIRLTQAPFLDRLMGDTLARSIDPPVRYGATVAHLSVYVAQHLGCDPIILVGQDLGFSDGLYYCPGTAIHDVWAPELSPFNTLETMEWKRIVRHRGHLSRLEDVHGQPIHSDEQMLTYLKQFERDFAHAPQTIIDATEGGLPKAHTQQMTLREALDAHARTPAPQLPPAEHTLDPQRLRAVRDQLASRIDELRELRQLSVKTVPLLREMIANAGDQKKIDRLYAKVDALRTRVHELDVIFSLINELNTIGAFRRHRDDRALELEGIDADPRADAADRLAKRLERDCRNVEWIIQACDEAVAIFADSLAKLDQQITAQATAHDAARDTTPPQRDQPTATAPACTATGGA